MRKRLEMRFLPILDFAEMKPQALQEAYRKIARIDWGWDFNIEKDFIIFLNPAYIFAEKIVILKRVKY